MFKTKISLAVIGSLFAMGAYADPHCDQMVPYGYPTIKRVVSSTMLCRIAYVTKHDNSRKTPIYSAEWLLGENLSSTNKRKDAFKADPDLNPSERAELSDYNEKYDRGHMVPFEDARSDTAAALQTFYLSNIIPQDLHLNRGLWRALENRVRNWASQSPSGVYVFTGPVYDKEPTYIGNGVAIPTRVYKVVINKELKQGIGFLVPNVDPDDGIKYPVYAVPIADVEKATGLNFAPSSRGLAKTQIGTWFKIP